MKKIIPFLVLLGSLFSAIVFAADNQLFIQNDGIYYPAYALFNSDFSSSTFGNTVIDVMNPKYGMVCDDVTPDDTAFQSVLADAVAATKAIIYFHGPKDCLLNNALFIPYTVTSTYSLPQQPSIRMTGPGPSWNPTLRDSMASSTQGFGSGLDLRYAGGGSAVAKVDTRGASILEIDHMDIVDNATDNYLFGQTTNTALDIHDDFFSGNPTCNNNCVQDVWSLGAYFSNDGTIMTYHPTDAFQGYGTKIYHNLFRHVNRFIYFGIDANGVEVGENTGDITNGDSSSSSAPYWFGPYGQNFGNNINGGIVETQGYAYTAYFADEATDTVDAMNTISGLGGYDGNATTLGYVYFSREAQSNMVIPGFFLGTDTLLKGPGASQNTVLSAFYPTQFSGTVQFNGAIKTPLINAPALGTDGSGNLIVASAASTTSNFSGSVNLNGTETISLAGAGTGLTLVQNNPDSVPYNENTTITMWNQATTTNAWDGMGFLDASGNIIAGMNSIAYDQANHYGSFNFATRGPINGWDDHVMVVKDGRLGINQSSPNATLEVNGNAMVDSGGSANHAVCWKSDGKTLGHCSSSVDSSGSCTCN